MRREIEDWNPGITFLDDWSYFDALKKKLGRIRLTKCVELFRKTMDGSTG